MNNLYLDNVSDLSDEQILERLLSLSKLRVMVGDQNRLSSAEWRIKRLRIVLAEEGITRDSSTLAHLSSLITS